MDGTARTLTYRYDPNGNRIRRQPSRPGIATFSYGYDQQDRLTGLSDGRARDWLSPVQLRRPRPAAAVREPRQWQPTPLRPSTWSAGSDSLYAMFAGGGGNSTTYLRLQPGPPDRRRSPRQRHLCLARPLCRRPRLHRQRAQPVQRRRQRRRSTYDANGNLDLGRQPDLTPTTSRTGWSAARAASCCATTRSGGCTKSAGPRERRRFLYDGDALVAEYTVDGALLARYVHGSKRPPTTR